MRNRGVILAFFICAFASVFPSLYGDDLTRRMCRDINNYGYMEALVMPYDYTDEEQDDLSTLFDIKMAASGDYQTITDSFIELITRHVMREDCTPLYSPEKEVCNGIVRQDFKTFEAGLKDYLKGDITTDEARRYYNIYQYYRNGRPEPPAKFESFDEAMMYAVLPASGNEAIAAAKEACKDIEYILEFYYQGNAGALSEVKNPVLRRFLQQADADKLIRAYENADL